MMGCGSKPVEIQIGLYRERGMKLCSRQLYNYIGDSNLCDELYLVTRGKVWANTKTNRQSMVGLKNWEAQATLEVMGMVVFSQVNGKF
jgi:hypothetical protein